jgi:hypothetical protein
MHGQATEGFMLILMLPPQSMSVQQQAANISTYAST